SHIIYTILPPTPKSTLFPYTTLFRSKKKTGAFYTPRFLAEMVLDVALEGMSSLLDKRFLDPACGSGIFLVGLFNRLAEEWARKRSEEHTSELQSRGHLVCRLLLEKKN